MRSKYTPIRNKYELQHAKRGGACGHCGGRIHPNEFVLQVQPGSHTTTLLDYICIRCLQTLAKFYAQTLIQG